ncbi:MAG: DUF1559 domain-containing protein [Gemmataceae bacterium]|nr:DUF1559 domain-containing protein [Gemmataceae bacterium]
MSIPFLPSRRQFHYLAGFGLVTGIGYELHRGVRRVHEAAARCSTQGRLCQLGVALHNYADTYGHFPPAYVLGPDGRPWHSWRVLVLPYIEQDPLFKEYRFDEPWDGPNNRRLADPIPTGYTLDRRDRPGVTTTDYLAVVGPRTMWPGPVGRRHREITSPPESTILLAENHGLDIPWMEPRDLDFASMSFEYNHPEGVSSRLPNPTVAMADGSVRSLDRWEPDDLRTMLTATDGKQVPADDRKPAPAVPARFPPDIPLREKW